MFLRNVEADGIKGGINRQTGTYPRMVSREDDPPTNNFTFTTPLEHLHCS